MEPPLEHPIGTLVLPKNMTLSSLVLSSSDYQTTEEKRKPATNYQASIDKLSSTFLKFRELEAQAAPRSSLGAGREDILAPRVAQEGKREERLGL